MVKDTTSFSDVIQIIQEFLDAEIVVKSEFEDCKKISRIAQNVLRAMNVEVEKTTPDNRNIKSQGKNISSSILKS